MAKRKEEKEPAPLTPPGSLRYFARQFIESMQISNFSEETVRARETYLNLFFRWCDERSVTELEQASSSLLERYQKYVYHYRKDDGEPLSFNSQITRLIHVKEFFKWCARKKHLPFNPASEIDLPRKETRLPKAVLTIEEVERVLNSIDLSSPFGVRDRTILEVLYSSGIRRMELVNLKLYDVDRSRGVITIRKGKGRKDRIVPIGERASYWMEKYIEDVRPDFVVEPDPGNIFLGRLGVPMTVDHLSVTVREIIEASGIEKTGSCHLFRHTMATLMLESGTDVRMLQELLGHARITTTQIYTQVSIKKLKEIHTALHPGAKLERRQRKIADE